MTDRKEKFTPGPWKRALNLSRGGSGQVRGPSISRVVDANGGKVAFATPRRAQVANLNLIAAAPEMYAYGEETVELMRRLVGMLPFGLDDEVKAQIAKWEEIAKKARGEE